MLTVFRQSWKLLSMGNTNLLMLKSASSTDQKHPLPSTLVQNTCSWDLKCWHSRGERVKDWVLVHFWCLTSSLALSGSCLLWQWLSVCQHLHRRQTAGHCFCCCGLDGVTSTAQGLLPGLPVPSCPRSSSCPKPTPKHLLSTSWDPPKNRLPSTIAFWNQP